MDGDIRFNVGANTAQFDAGMAGVANSANTAAAKIKTAFAGIGGLLVGGAAFAGLKSLMNDLDAVAKMATRFGTSAESIQRVSLAADLAGTSIDVVAQAMQKVGIAASKANRDGGTLAETFALAGINAEQFNKANLDEKLLMVAKAFEAARGNADKTNAIIELLGARSAGQLIPLLSNVEALQAEMANAAVASDDFVSKVEAANDRMTRLGNTIKVAFAGGLEALTTFSERIGSLIGGGGGKTIAEMEADEMRANAEARLRARGELLAEDTQTINRGVSNPTRRDFEEGTAWKEVIPGPNAEENVRRVNAELEKMRAELVAAEKSTIAITEETEEQVSKTEERRQQMQKINEITLQIREAEAAGNKALADDLSEYKSLVEAAIKYEGDLEMAARDVNAAHKERLRLQDEALQKSIAQVEKEIELAEAIAFGTDEAKSQAKWIKEYEEVLAKTGRDDLARRAANAATFDQPSSSQGGGFSNSTTRPTSAMDRLRESAGDFNAAAMAEESRIMARGSRGEQRAAELEAAGQFRSAAAIRAREEERRQKDAQQFEDRQAARARQKEIEAMSPLERSKAQAEDRKLAREQEKMAKDAAKSEKERERASEDAVGGGAGGQKSDPAEQILTFLRDTFFKDFQSRLPQNALS